MQIFNRPTRVMGGLLLTGNSLFSQIPPSGVAALLGSARNDIWVFGVDRDPSSGSVVVEIHSWKVPINLWGATGNVSAPGALLYSERPRDWDWGNRPARNLHGSLYYHLSKYDEHSAFAADWGFGKRQDGTLSYEGTILRLESGRLTILANAISQARVDYHLSDSQWFVGMVGNRVFYFDDRYTDFLFFFEKGTPTARFKIKVPVHENWSKKYRLEVVTQVFEGESPFEIMAYVWVRYTGLVAAYRRFSRGIPIDLRSAVTFAPGSP